MQCVIATNGTDDGEDFVRECRKMQPSVPIIVYCMNVSYHREWAAAISSGSTSQIQVTGTSSDVFQFISNIFSDETKPKSLSYSSVDKNAKVDDSSTLESLTSSNLDHVITQKESWVATLKIWTDSQANSIASMRKEIEMKLVEIKSQVKELVELRKMENKLAESAENTEPIIQMQKQPKIQKQNERTTFLQKRIEDQKAQIEVWFKILQQIQQVSIHKPINAFDTAPSDLQQRLRNPPEGIRTIRILTSDSPSNNVPEIESGSPALINFPHTSDSSVRPGQPLLSATEGPSRNVTFAVIGQQRGQGVIEPVVPSPFDISSYGIYQVTIFDDTLQKQLISTRITVLPELKICVPKKFVIKDSLNNIVVGGRITLKRSNGTITFTGITDSTGNAHIR
ncbi:unnamed protein product [Didymodactylos carnosus]|uniref:Uncharacterized protein n=1 Tax=Didymodactylos carnosus TaxID=1234261 RepID=A0A8S2YE31_9BILA|nr:unnamed protein product [Didymodactylos carnosus]